MSQQLTPLVVRTSSRIQFPLQVAEIGAIHVTIILIKSQVPLQTEGATVGNLLEGSFPFGKLPGRFSGDAIFSALPLTSAHSPSVSSTHGVPREQGQPRPSPPSERHGPPGQAPGLPEVLPEGCPRGPAFCSALPLFGTQLRAWTRPPRALSQPTIIILGAINMGLLRWKLAIVGLRMNVL